MRASREQASAVAAVAAGGVLGSGARLALDALLPHADATWPWSTLTANLLGALALGILVAGLWPVAPAWLRAGLGAGLLGSFTTFSALALSLLAMAEAGAAGLAALYLVVSLALGLAAAWLGLRLGATLHGRRLRRGPAIGADE
ncbi:FluC/FEX family fluoride channel [Homoserinibacter sp. YIM 151385]|uniref:FluC/FEX family fluoride channel n=1 Tax=Homoserinibacter sp. YIM 151385 TaxID=2985506 RepID=UPI0022F0F21D|nr:CrcB family protein [Homoserinibacter sp. YIM 151385]WBU37400.1 CrcB family protein [Homoserinibacter sp. YIM 151385]